MSTHVNTQESILPPVTKVESTSEPLLARLKSSVTWAKIFRWEFWPFSVFYFPVMFYWIWMTVRTRSFFFFTASNPSIENGGMLGESKDKIFKLIPERYIPKTFKLVPGISPEAFDDEINRRDIGYPFVLKPDIGERGWMVEIIRNSAELLNYLEKIRVPFLVQELIDYPIELGIFYYRYPDRVRGTVSSVVIKEMLTVSGDGRSTVYQLMENDPRSLMHRESLSLSNPSLMPYIPKNGEKVELVSIGNHCRGTTFLDGNRLITDKLIKVFDQVSQQIDGFYFGRYDLKCRSIEELYEGQGFKILELNGAGAEPAHIYQPGYSLMQAYKDIIHHLRVLMEISMINNQNGVSYMSLMDGLREVQKIRRYNKAKAES